jgi:hypothetical protein
VLLATFLRTSSDWIATRHDADPTASHHLNSRKYGQNLVAVLLAGSSIRYKGIKQNYN